MKTEFTVTENSPKYEYMGKTYFFCCPKGKKEHKDFGMKNMKDCKNCDMDTKEAPTAT